VDKLCAAWNLPLTEVAIGFRFIAPELMKPGALFGAEESGSVGFANHLPERGGLAAGLMLLEMLAMERTSVNRSYARLEREYFPQQPADTIITWPFWLYPYTLWSNSRD
jgi:phosphomannomutase